MAQEKTNWGEGRERCSAAEGRTPSETPAVLQSLPFPTAHVRNGAGRRAAAAHPTQGAGAVRRATVAVSPGR